MQGRPKDRGWVGPRPHYIRVKKLYIIRVRSNTSFLRGFFVFLSLPLFAAAVHGGTPALGDLLLAPGAGIPGVAAPVPAPVQAETFPEYEQDRKPARQLSKAGGVRVLDGVRFERDAEKNIYRWGQLRVEDAALEEVYFGFRSASVGHNYLMFSFKDGTRLVVEVLPWKKKGEKFDPIVAGMTGKYDLVWNLVSFDSFLETAVGRDGLYVDIYPLKVSREEKLRLLDEAITEATRDHRGEKYHTFFNSCSSNAIKVFTRATGHHLVVGRMLPSVVIKHLKLRGFLGERQHYDASNWRNL